MEHLPRFPFGVFPIYHLQASKQRSRMSTKSMPGRHKQSFHPNHVCATPCVCECVLFMCVCVSISHIRIHRDIHDCIYCPYVSTQMYKCGKVCQFSVILRPTLLTSPCPSYHPITSKSYGSALCLFSYMFFNSACTMCIVLVCIFCSVRQLKVNWSYNNF